MSAMTTTYSRSRRAAGWSVHAYTALGLVCGFYALRETVAGNAQATFLWLFTALVIDSTDGMLARAVDVKHVVPEYDGRKLDDITDYLNYVFIPVYFAFRFQLVPAGCDWVLALPLLASAYGFCSESAKTNDGYFTGFPSYWNVLVFYLYILGVKPWAGALLFGYLALMVFWPVKYLYPSQAPRFRRPLIALTLVWFVAYVFMVFNVHSIPPVLAWGSLAYPAFYFAFSFWLHFTDGPAHASPPAMA